MHVSIRYFFYNLLHGKLLYFVAVERILDLHFLISLNKFIKKTYGATINGQSREKKKGTFDTRLTMKTKQNTHLRKLKRSPTWVPLKKQEVNPRVREV